MKIKTICYSPEFEESADYSRIYYFDENDTLESIKKLDEFRYFNLCLRKYYPVAGTDIRERVPYVDRNGEMLWNVSYSEATLADIISTNHIDIDAGVELEFIGVGGFGDELISGAYALWLKYSPIIVESIHDIQDIAAVFSILKYLIEHFNKNEEKTPEFWDMVDFLEKEKKWDTDILSPKIGLDESNVRNILRKIGFVERGKYFYLDKEINKRFHEMSARKVEKFWGNMYLSAINVNILLLKYLKEKYGIGYKEKAIENKIDNTLKSTTTIFKGRGIRVLERKKFVILNRKRRLNDDNDVLFELYNLTDKEVKKARKKAGI